MYTYFDYNDPKSYAPENIIRVLLKQILFKSPLLPRELEKFYDECKRQGKSPDKSSLKQYLFSTWSAFERAIVLFDALDECSPKMFKETIEIIGELRVARAKVFCTSRTNASEIREKLGNPPVTEIRANHEEVVNYISTRLDWEWDYDVESKQTILDSFVDKAEEKFISSHCSPANIL